MTPRRSNTLPEETRKLRIEPEPGERRSAWYLLTGLILGMFLGLIYSWVINPVIYTYTVPANLDDQDKSTYRSLIAQVYAATNNYERAASRLALLEDEDSVYILGAQAQRALAKGDAKEAHALAYLASSLMSQSSSSQETDLPPSPDPTSTATPVSVPTQTLPPITPMP